MAGIMFLQFYKLREQPFGVTPDPGYLYLSSTHREALASLVNSVESGVGFSALVAPPGMGKTTLLVHLLKHFEGSAQVGMVFETQCNSQELLQSLVEEFEIDTKEASGEDALPLARIHRFLVDNARLGRRVLVVVDEAQNLQVPVLETLRLLSNFETEKAKLLHIVLAGQPQLTRELARPELEQLRQRVAIYCKLNPFTAVETVKYVAHRLQCAGYRGGPLFTPEALGMLAISGRGIPREINRLCFNALSVGFKRRKRVIDAEIMGQAVNELQDVRSEADASERKENIGGLPRGVTPQDLGFIFARAMTSRMGPGPQQLRAASDTAIPGAAANRAIAVGRNANRTPQSPTAEQSTKTDWMGALTLADRLAAAQPKRGLSSALRLCGLIAVAAVVLCAALVWSGGISSSIFGARERAIRKAELDRALWIDRRNAYEHKNNPADLQLGDSAPAAGTGLQALEPDSKTETLVKAANENHADRNRAKFRSGSGNTGEARGLNLRRSDPSSAAARTTGGQDAAAQTQSRTDSEGAGAGQSSQAAAPSPAAVSLMAAAAPSLPASVATNGLAEAPKPVPSAHPNLSTNHAEATETIVAPKLLKRVNPVYPEAARRRGISGKIVLTAHINTLGQVEEVSAISGNPFLAQAAIDAVRQWVYSPLSRNGKPQPSDETIVMGFSLR